MGSNGRFLITTADERGWRFDVPVLFLGDWCRTYSCLDRWKDLDAIVVPYHWDDRDKLYRDWLWLRALHEKLLEELSLALNAAHGVRRSTRYWRILVGPWLQYFTQMLFDRWEMIHRSVERYAVTGTISLAFSPDQIVPHGMADFRDLYSDDVWNHAIFATIIQGWTDIPRERIAVDCHSSVGRQLIPHSSGALARIRRTVKAGAAAVSERLMRSSDALLISTYLPFKQACLLQLALGQFPSLHKITPPPQRSVDLAVRAELRLESAGHRGFEDCVRRLVPEHIPTAYLEGYQALISEVGRLRWPTKPRVIFTANCYATCDVFKAWTASQVERGTPLVIGQHGGNLGSARWSSSEDHEHAIADRYVTWGWTEGDPKQHPVGALNKVMHDRSKWNPTGHLLIVTSMLPRYSYVLGSYPTSAAQTEMYLADQYTFVRALPKRIYHRSVIRLFRPDWGWDQEQRWRDQFPDGRLDPGAAPIEPLIRQSRLCIVTSNGTSVLELLSRNNPTIIFWNPRLWELRDSAAPYFDLLRDVGIFFVDPTDAAEKASDVWDDVTGWWSSRDVQEARRQFCDRFARTPRQLIPELRRVLLSERLDT